MPTSITTEPSAIQSPRTISGRPTAATMRAYLNTPGGAVYGFAPETLLRSPVTAVPGLFLASAWAAGGGYTGAMMGGAMAVKAALRDG